MQARERLFQALDRRGHLRLGRLEVESGRAPSASSTASASSPAVAFVVAVGIVPFAAAALFLVVFCERGFVFVFFVSKKRSNEVTKAFDILLFLLPGKNSLCGLAAKPREARENAEGGDETEEKAEKEEEEGEEEDDVVAVEVEVVMPIADDVASPPPCDASASRAPLIPLWPRREDALAINESIAIGREEQRRLRKAKQSSWRVFCFVF